MYLAVAHVSWGLPSLVEKAEVRVLHIGGIARGVQLGLIAAEGGADALVLPAGVLSDVGEAHPPFRDTSVARKPATRCQEICTQP